MKIALIGYGKMGHMIEQIAKQRGHEIVCIIDLDNQEDFESAAFASAEVAIEFTAPHTAWGNIQRAWSKGVKVVSGSTGWRQDHGEEASKACTEGGHTLFWASNYSIGVAIFSAVNRYLARLMNQFPQYDVEETETHHIHKLDHPSGTGITLAEQIVKELDRKQSWQMGKLTQPDGTEVAAPEALRPDSLPIHSIREGEVPGIHSIRWDSEADEIIITHNAHSRQGFALGAVLAAEFAATHTGLLTIDDMFPF